MAESSDVPLIDPTGELGLISEADLKKSGGLAAALKQGFRKATNSDIQAARAKRFKEDHAQEIAAMPKQETEGGQAYQASGVPGTVDWITHHPYLVPGALVPGAAWAAVNAIAPGVGEPVANAASGYAQGVAKSFADIPVGLGGLAAKAGAWSGAIPDEWERGYHENVTAPYEQISEGAKEQHPYAVPAGEIGGTVGQALFAVGGGFGAPATGKAAVSGPAQLGLRGATGPIGLVSAVGSGLSKGVEAKLVSSGAAKVAEKVLGSGLVKAVAKGSGVAIGAGTEGLILHLAELDKQLEADPAPTVDKYMAGMETAALLGAGLGVGAEVAAPVFRGLSGMVKRAGAEVSGMMVGAKTAKRAQEVGEYLIHHGLLQETAEGTVTSVANAKSETSKQLQQAMEGISGSANMTPEEDIEYIRDLNPKSPVGKQLHSLADKYEMLNDIQQIYQKSIEGDSRAAGLLGLLRLRVGIGSTITALEFGNALMHGDVGTAVGTLAAGLAAKQLMKQSEGLAAQALFRGGRALALTDGAEAFVRAAGLAARAFLGGPSPLDHGPESPQEHYDRIVKALNGYTPDKARQVGDNIVGSDAGGHVRSAAVSRAGAVAEYLNTKIPPATGYNPFDPSGPGNVSDSDMEEFLIHTEGTSGKSFLAAFKSHTLTTAHVEALEATNPAALETIRAEVAKNLGNASDLSVVQEEQLSTLFGVQGDPDFIRSLQEGYGSIEDLKEAQGKQGDQRQKSPARPLSDKPFWTNTDQVEADQGK